MEETLRLLSCILLVTDHREASTGDCLHPTGHSYRQLNSAIVVDSPGKHPSKKDCHGGEREGGGERGLLHPKEESQMRKPCVPARALTVDDGWCTPSDIHIPP